MGSRGTNFFLRRRIAGRRFSPALWVDFFSGDAPSLRLPSFDCHSRSCGSPTTGTSCTSTCPARESESSMLRQMTRSIVLQSSRPSAQRSSCSSPRSACGSGRWCRLESTCPVNGRAITNSSNFNTLRKCLLPAQRGVSHRSAACDPHIATEHIACEPTIAHQQNRSCAAPLLHAVNERKSARIWRRVGASLHSSEESYGTSTRVRSRERDGA